MPRGGNRQGAGRKGGWKNSETQVIRVPKILAAQILDYARQLDSGLLPFISEQLKDLPDKVLDFETKSNPLSDLADYSISPGQLRIDGLNDSETESKTKLIDFETKSNVPPNKPDGLRWLSSEQAWKVSQARGCDRNLEGFRKRASRHPEEALDQYGLRRLPLLVRGRNDVPVFEDLRYNDDPDCQDF